MGVDIDNDRVRQLAQVSRLKLTEDEVETYQAQLSSILTTISEVKTMDTEGVEPMLYPRVLGNVMRPDKAGDSMPREQALANGPVVKDGMFQVPRILEEE
ncbi:MAG: Asp-tRNA(Asn)/Glu-tRNA(Gln) amidotransferase subunit GatC [Firmicutes bacterium]|nr:Asp-tRNA(Asn)/Glu-tRNA(Gln) amidotransferase subunit GatC [Bacillota bacterium]